MDAVWALAKEHALPVHLDGARIFNAALALGVEPREIARRVDSVMCCLSKGLCAPVGSLLVGSAAFIEEARYKRKIMGGGMRQAGILAAAGILSLTEQIKHLEADHLRTKGLAKGLSEIEGIVIKVDDVEINMIFFTWPKVKKKKNIPRVMEIFKKYGILINPPERGVFRFATHFWIQDAEIETILKASREAFGN
jgi:threonine aldolase